jgi:lysyl-tRNA synthetase class 2
MSPELLKNRALMLKKARMFFEMRNVLEVDCGALVKRAPIDANIDVMTVSVSPTEQGFLHTSPEYAMKKLLSEGAPDIYFLGHVFRRGEIGRRHSPEFTMAEWYRIGFSLAQMIEETSSFLSLFLGDLPIRHLSYRDAFLEYAKINYTEDPLPTINPSWSRTETLHYILSHEIEPYLGKDELTILTDYPPYEAALACVVEKKGEWVAERFEIYHKGVELANGYHELSDAEELQNRFEKENKMRLLRGDFPYELDEAFLASMRKGIPDCCGVSVGFDRALMLQEKKESLFDILPFYWQEKK